MHLRGRGAVAFHLDLASSAAVRRAFALLAELRVPAEIRTYTTRSFDRATRYQLHVEGSEHALGVLAEAGVLGRRSSAARPAAGPRRRPLVLPRRLPARRVPRRRLAHRPAVAAPRGADADAGRRVVPAQRRLGRGGPAAGRASARRHARAYAKGWEEIEGYLLAAGVVDAVLALEERSVIAEMRAEANRLANADHANLVRTAHAAQRQLDAARGLRASGALESLPEPAAGGRARCGSAIRRCRCGSSPSARARRRRRRACSGGWRRWSSWGRRRRSP